MWKTSVSQKHSFSVFLIKKGSFALFRAFLADKKFCHRF